MTAVYIFSTEGPMIAIDLMGLAPEQYGLFSLIPAFGLGAGMLSAGLLADKVRPRISMLSGTMIALTGVLIMFFVKQWIGVWSLFIPTGLVFFGSNFTWVYASSAGISEATDKSNASAVMQFINVGTATAGTFLTGAIGPKAFYTLPAAFGIVAVIMLALWLALSGHHRRRGHA